MIRSEIGKAMASNSPHRTSVGTYNFTEEPDSALQCVICLEVAEDPWQHGGDNCGRLLCCKCLELLGRGMPCPNCRGERPVYFEDHRSKREIKCLGVKCSNMDRGCEWVGTVGTLEKHVATCKFTLVTCPQKCNDKVIMKKDLHEHLKKDCPNRDYWCGYCGEKGTHANITQVHDLTCEKKILPCPNSGCDANMERQQVDEHVRTKCPHTVIPCKYQGIGCDTELKREDMAAHEQDDKLHLHMALETVNSLQIAVKSLKVLQGKLQQSQQGSISDLQHTISSQQNAIKKLQVATGSQEITTTYQVSAISKLQKTTTLQEDAIGKLHHTISTQQGVISKLQDTTSFQAIAIGKLQNTQQSAISKLQDTASSREGAISKLQDIASSQEGAISKLQDIVSSQEGAISKLQDTISSQEGAISKLQDTASSQEGAISTLQDTTSSQKKDMSNMQSAINLQQGAVNKLQEMITSQQNTLNSLQDAATTLKGTSKTYATYTLSDYKKKKDAETDLTFTNSFYTHPGGYHMTLRVDANGCGTGKGTHVSVFAPLLKGKYDDAGLKWPLTGSITFTMLNQLEDKNHHATTVKLTTESNARLGVPTSSWGFKTFIPHSALAHDSAKNTQYLKDDTLYFRVSVKVDDRKPWLE